MESNDKIFTNEKIENNEMEKISIKVKTIDSNEYIVNANRASLISEVKKQLEEVIKFFNKILQNNFMSKLFKIFRIFKILNRNQKYQLIDKD